MVLLVIAVVVGLVIGLTRPRAGVHAVRPHVEQIPLLAVGALLNAISALLDGTAATLCLAASLAVLIAVATVNRHITGIAVVGVGLLLNLVAVAVNAGVPVRASALVDAGVVDAADLPTLGLTGARHLESSADALGVLGDVLPIPFAHEVISFGDLIIVFGAADAVRELSRRRARPQGAASAVYSRRSPTRRASVDQVWGTAPSGLPVSASQYSANPEAATPARIDLDREAAAVRSYTELVASQSK